MSTFGPERLRNVKGYADRSNDIVYASHSNDINSADLVIFFPGDIQNYKEEMTASTKEEIECWNIEAVAQRLATNFPSKHIMVVKPIRTKEKVFNYYDNFVTLNKFGGPDYLKSRFALLHLTHLVANVMENIKALFQAKCGNNDSSIRESTIDSSEVDSVSNAYECFNTKKSVIAEGTSINSVSLVGFSKGCVVLNQIVTEIYLMSELPEEERLLCINFLQKVSEIAWLDGGHQGREGTWITNPNFVKKLVQTLPQLTITIHVTPYQMSDAARPWIGNECRRFVALCQEAVTADTDRVRYTLHGAHHKHPTLATHFLALQAYGG